MIERPILFSGPMVHAILDGSKTMTRRVVKLKEGRVPILSEGRWRQAANAYVHQDLPLRCPYGAPGDELWVRETWAAQACYDKAPPRSIPHGHIYYLASPELGAVNVERWRPSIHMPRWASRIQLRVTDVRVERVQEISPVDACHEGVECDEQAIPGSSVFNVPMALENFQTLWDSINAKRGFGWDTNPWVWVVCFERIRP